MALAKHRQKTFIDPAVQGTLLKRVVLHWLCFIGTSIAAITVLQVILGDPEKTIVEHMKTGASQYALFFIVMFTLLPAFILDTIRLSHRFAGPVYRLHETFRSLAKGEAYYPIRFRENDFWTDVSDDFNRMMETLEKRVPGLITDTPAAEADPVESLSKHAESSEAEALV